jgi:hypothetical protein
VTCARGNGLGLVVVIRVPVRVPGRAAAESNVLAGFIDTAVYAALSLALGPCRAPVASAL